MRWETGEHQENLLLVQCFYYTFSTCAFRTQAPSLGLRRRPQGQLQDLRDDFRTVIWFS
jgi:hypothetical protein